MKEEEEDSRDLDEGREKGYLAVGFDFERGGRENDGARQMEPVVGR